MKGFKDKNKKFHPVRDYKGVRKSRDQFTKTQGIRLGKTNNQSIIRKKSAIEEPNVLDKQITKLEKSFKEGLDKTDWNNPRLKGTKWDIDIAYEGSHGTVDSEYFTITAHREGVGSVSYTEAFSNDNWFDPDDTKRSRKIENDPDFAQMEYEKWLAGMLELYEDAMFEGLMLTIEDEYK